MASPLATTSRHMLGMRLRGSGRAAISVVAEPSAARLSFSTARSRGQEAGVATPTRSNVSDAGVPPSAQAPASQEAPEQTLAERVAEASEQAAQKAYYDNLEARQRLAQVDEQRKETMFKMARMKQIEALGSTQTRQNSFRPHQARLTPVTARELTISHLLAATAHVGHAKSSLDQAAASFVYGTRHGQSIIDVERFTLPALRLACKVVKDIVFRDGVVVFVGTAEGTEDAVLAAATRLGKNGFHVTGRRWLPGTLSNASKVLARAIMANAPTYEAFLEQEQIVQAERDAVRDERRRAKGQYVARKRFDDKSDEFDPANLAAMRLKPDLMIVLNPKNNVYAIQEATQAGVPTIGVTDTDVDPRLVTYAIPANDESVRTAELIVGVLSKAGQDGLEARRQWEDEVEKRQSLAARQARSSRQREREVQYDEEEEEYDVDSPSDR